MEEKKKSTQTSIGFTPRLREMTSYIESQLGLKGLTSIVQHLIITEYNRLKKENGVVEEINTD